MVYLKKFGTSKKTKKEEKMNLKRSPNPACGCVLFTEYCQIMQSGTHDLTPDFLPEEEFAFSATDLCGKKAMGDMFVVRRPDDYVTRSVASMHSDKIEGYIEPDCLSAEIIEV
jgi:hypothetical protein